MVWRLINCITFFSILILISPAFLDISQEFESEGNSTLLNDEISINDHLHKEIEKNKILQNFNHLKGFFTENKGQIGNDFVRYYIGSMGVWLLNNSVVFQIVEDNEKSDESFYKLDSYDKDYREKIHRYNSKNNILIKLNFEDSNYVEPMGKEMLPHKTNFFIGNDSSKWYTNVRNYREIYYRNLYDNIDLRYYITPEGLKYDFIVHSGGKISDIRMNYEGSKELLIDDINNIKVKTPLGDITDSNLLIYQLNEKSKELINGRFKLFDSMTYGFELVGDYNANEDLIIDPLIYSTFIGGKHDDWGEDIAIDSNKNAYVTGSTYSPNFPSTNGSFNTTNNNYFNICVFKLNPNGSKLLFSSFFGGSENDTAQAIVIDTFGNSYITGTVESSNFPTTKGAYDTTYNGDYDTFALKLNSTGSGLIYSTFVGGTDSDDGFDLIIDKKGNTYVCGMTMSSDFPTTKGAYDRSHNWFHDAFFFRLNHNGSSLNYSTFIGSNDEEDSRAIAIDSNCNVYLTGWVETGVGSSNFPVTLGAYDTQGNGYGDIYILKLNLSTSKLIYSTFIGGANSEGGESIIIDQLGNAYVTGWTASTNFPTTNNAYDKILNGGSDCVIIKLNSQGSKLLYSTYIGGGGGDVGYDIEIDLMGNTYVTGYTYGFPTTSNAYDTTKNGGEEGFICVMNVTNGYLLYSTYIGGSNRDFGKGIEIGPDFLVYITGTTVSSNFPTTPGVNDTIYNGNKDIFVLKLKLPFNNSMPLVLDLNISKQTIFRTDSIKLYSNASDLEDIEKNLTPFFEYRDPTNKIWNKTYFSNIQYNNSRWVINFTPPKNVILGYYDFRVRFNDTFPLFSFWYYLNDSLLMLNNKPNVLDMKFSNSKIVQDKKINIWINGTDIENDEKDLTVELQYKAPLGTSWNITYLKQPIFINDRWEINFTAPFDSPFGDYDFRARIIDLDGNYSNWFYKNNSLLVYNLNPEVLDISINKNYIYRTTPLIITINGTDHETLEDKLSCKIQYRAPSGVWTELTNKIFNIDRWQVIFNPSSIMETGAYDLRVNFTDMNGAYSGWFEALDKFVIMNNKPIAENIDYSSLKVLRSNSITIKINGKDIENHEDLLNLEIQYRSPTGNWITLTETKFESDHWEVNFKPSKFAELGYYDFRVKFIDLDNDNSSWLVNLDEVQVLNNKPHIVTADVTLVNEDNFYYVAYSGTDIESEDLLWTFDSNASWLNWGSENKTLYGTPHNDDVGKYWVRINISDSDGLFDEHNFTLMVINTNDRPNIKTQNQLIAYEDEYYKVSYTALDVDVGDTLKWTFESNAQWLHWGPTNHTLYGLPLNEDVGEYWVTINVTDGNGGFDQHHFTLTVKNINDPPIIDGAPSNLRVTAYEKKILDLTQYITDVDNDTSELTIQANSEFIQIEGLKIIFNYTNEINSENVIILVSDGINVSEPHNILITVIPKDITSPVIIKKFPVGKDIVVDTIILIEFSEPMQRSSVISAFTILPDVKGYFSLINTTFIFDSFENFEYNTTYFVTLKTTAMDLFWNPVKEKCSWNFTTEIEPIVTTDTDGDNFPDSIDDDDDNDGYLDVWEEYMSTAVNDSKDRPIDTDFDGHPDGDTTNSQPWMDIDDDNDGFTDSEELKAGSDPLDEKDIPKREGKENGLDPIYIILSVIILLIIILVILSFIFIKKRKSDKKD